MDATELFAMEGEMAEKAFTAFRKAWFGSARKSDPKRVDTGGDLEALQRVFAARWTAYRHDGC